MHIIKPRLGPNKVPKFVDTSNRHLGTLGRWEDKNGVIFGSHQSLPVDNGHGLDIQINSPRPRLAILNAEHVTLNLIPAEIKHIIT